MICLELVLYKNLNSWLKFLFWMWIPNHSGSAVIGLVHLLQAGPWGRPGPPSIPAGPWEAWFTFYPSRALGRLVHLLFPQCGGRAVTSQQSLEISFLTCFPLEICIYLIIDSTSCLGIWKSILQVWISTQHFYWLKNNMTIFSFGVFLRNPHT